MTVAAIAALVLLAVLSSESRWIAIYFCLGLTAVFALFTGLGKLIAGLARRAPRSRIPEIALAIGNLGGPGGLTRSTVLSLGAGLSLLVAVALTDHSMVRELTTHLPETSPTYFVLDIRRDDAARFRELVDRVAPGSEIRDAPMLRGLLVQLGGRPVDQIRPTPEAQWVLSGDRGLTYSETVPEGSRIVAGNGGRRITTASRWFRSRRSSRGTSIGLGDTVTVNVLGRNITARIANLREVQWNLLPSTL